MTAKSGCCKEPIDAKVTFTLIVDRSKLGNKAIVPIADLAHLGPNLGSATSGTFGTGTYGLKVTPHKSMNSTIPLLEYAKIPYLVAPSNYCLPWKPSQMAHMCSCRSLIDQLIQQQITDPVIVNSEIIGVIPGETTVYKGGEWSNGDNDLEFSFHMHSDKELLQFGEVERDCEIKRCGTLVLDDKHCYNGKDMYGAPNTITLDTYHTRGKRYTRIPTYIWREQKTLDKALASLPPNMVYIRGEFHKLSDINLEIKYFDAYLDFKTGPDLLTSHKLGSVVIRAASPGMCIMHDLYGNIEKVNALKKMFTAKKPLQLP